MLQTHSQTLILSPIAKKLTHCITEIEKNSLKKIDPKLLDKFSKLALQADLKDFAYPGVLLTKILYSSDSCRAILFEALIKARPDLDLIFAPLDPNKKKCALNLIAYKNAQDLWDVIERNNISLRYDMIVDSLAIFCSDDIIYQMFALFDRQNPDYDYMQEAETWLYPNTIAPIFIAADYGHSRVFKFLLEKRCSVFEFDSQETKNDGPNTRACLDFALQRKPLHAHLQKNNGVVDDLAVEKRRSYFEILDLIYKTLASQPGPVDLHLYYAQRSNPLHSAIEQKDISLVLKMITLIKKYSAFIRCTIDTPDEYFQTPLMYALRGYHINTHESDSKIFELLVAQGARLDIIEHSQLSPFFFLRTEHPVSFAHRIIDKVFSSSDADYKARFLAPICLAPLEKNHDVNYIAHYGLFQGKTIVHHAAFLAHTCVLEKLLKHGVSFQHQDLIGFSPLFSYIASPHNSDLELFKAIIKHIADQGCDIFETESGFSVDSELDFETQQLIAEHIDYFRSFNVFELSIFFQRIDFVIALIEAGALQAQVHLHRNNFFKLMIDTMASRDDSLSFAEKFAIPLFTYLKNHEEHLLTLFFEDFEDLVDLVLKPRIYVNMIEFIDTIFPDFFFKHIDTLVYQEALNAFSVQHDFFPNQTNLLWYKSFLTRWATYRNVHNKDLICANHFSPHFLSRLWDSQHRDLVDDFIQQACLQIKRKDHDRFTELYALEKSDFIEKMITFFIASDSPRNIDLLLRFIDAGAFAAFLKHPNSISQLLDWINSAYNSVTNDHKEVIQCDIDLLYLYFFDYALKQGADFEWSLDHLSHESKSWIDRVLVNKTLKKTTLMSLIEKKWKKDILSQSEIVFFAKFYKKISTLQNKKTYFSIASEIDSLIKKMIFDNLSQSVLLYPLGTHDFHRKSLTEQLAVFESSGLSLNQRYRHILVLSILLNTKKIDFLDLNILEKEVFLSKDFSDFVERVRPDLVSDYQVCIAQQGQPTKFIERLEPSPSLIEDVYPESISEIVEPEKESSDSITNEAKWIQMLRREKKSSKKRETLDLSRKAKKEISSPGQKPAVLFKKGAVCLETNQPDERQQSHAPSFMEMPSYNKDFPSLSTTPTDSMDKVIETESYESLSSMSDQKTASESSPVLFQKQPIRIIPSFLFSDRDLGTCTKDRLNRLIDFKLDDLYEALQKKDYQDIVDIWEHLKDYLKNQVAEQIIDVITLIKSGKTHQAEQLMEAISFQSLLLKQRYGSEKREHAYFYFGLVRQHIEEYHKLFEQAQKHLTLAKQAEIKALSLIKRKSDNPKIQEVSREQKEKALKKMLGLK